MRPTRVSHLLGIAALAAVLSVAVVRVWAAYSELPRVPVSAPITLIGLAVAVLATALALRSRLRAVRERRPDAKPVDPLVAARAVVLAKASALVGAVFVGIYLGYGAYLLRGLDFQQERGRLIMCGLCVLAGALLVAAALFLERVCRVPPPTQEPDDTEDRPMLRPDS